MGTPFVGDVGTEFILNVGVDISAATVTTIVVKKPDGTLVEWAGTVDGASIRYTSVVGDLSVAGIYKLQAKVTLPTWSGLGTVAKMNVAASLA